MTFKFQNSLYTVSYLNYASWSDAEQDCDKKRSHLWSINSFDEWYDVYQAVQQSSMIVDEKDSSTNLIMISTLLFIGLTQNNLVK